MDNYAELELFLKSAVEDGLRKYLRRIDDKFLYETMGYTLLAGGKRARASLLLACAFGEPSFTPFACALECIHAYSLIHDDLPAMDNDDLRRGLPSNHVKYGEAAAILAGDGLLNFAYEIMISECVNNFSTRKLLAANLITDAAGVNGMVSGQVKDMFENIADEKTLTNVYERKTGALIKAACVAGAILGNCEEQAVIAVTDAAGSLGRAFQLKDDLLDVYGDEKIIGKPIGSDKKNKKRTFVSMFGKERTETEFKDASQKAVDGFSSVYGENSYAVYLVKKITERIR